MKSNPLSWLWRRPEPLLLFLAVCLQFRQPWDAVSTIHGDAPRFRYQAHGLVDEGAFLRYPEVEVPPAHVDRLETSLPPGFPVFLAPLLALSGEDAPSFLRNVRIAQLVLLLLACLFVMLALRPVSTPLAVAAGVALAAIPALQLSAAALRSELLATFLAAWSALLLARCEQSGPTALRCLGIGGLFAALVLTAPAMAVVGLPILVHLAWRVRGAPRLLALLVVGLAIPALPWGVHVLRASGRVPLTVYDPLPFTKSEVTRWLRSWSRNEENLRVMWGVLSPEHSPDLAALPSDERTWALQAMAEGFVDRAERQRQDYDPVAVAAGHDSRRQPFFREDLERAFGAAANARIARDPWGYHVRLPLARAAALWGAEVRGRSGTLLLDALLENLITLFALCAVAWATWAALFRRASWYGVALALGLLGYTFVSAYFGFGEERRNLPLYPLLFSAFVVDASVCRKSSGNGEREGDAGTSLDVV